MLKSTVYICTAQDRATHYGEAVSIGLSVPASANGEEPVSHYYAHGWVEAGVTVPDWVEVFLGNGTSVENVETLLVSKGLQHVEEHEPPGPEPKLPDLQAYQFHALLGLAQIQDAVEAAIAALPEPDAIVVKARLAHTPTFKRSDPLFVMLGPSVGLTPEQIDTFWLWAAGL